MEFLKATSSAIARFFSAIPIDLRLGVTVTGVLISVLFALIVFDVSEIELTAASNLLRYWLFGVALLFLLTICAVFKTLFEGVLAKTYGLLQWILFGSYIGLFITFYSILISVVFSLADIDWVVPVSLWYISFDSALGVHKGLELLIEFVLAHPFLYEVIRFCYAYTANMMAIGFLVLCIFSARLLRSYLLAMFVSLILASVIWIISPAMAPHQLAVFDKTSDSVYAEEIKKQTASVMQFVANNEGTQWEDQVVRYDEYWEDATRNYGYPISSNPSMHIIWGVLLIYFMCRVHYILGCLASLFVFFEAIGTMLFLQHYLLDIPVGIVVGLIAIYISKKLVMYEKEDTNVDTGFWFGSKSKPGVSR